MNIVEFLRSEKRLSHSRRRETNVKQLFQVLLISLQHYYLASTHCHQVWWYFLLCGLVFIDHWYYCVGLFFIDHWYYCVRSICFYWSLIFYCFFLGQNDIVRIWSKVEEYPRKRSTWKKETRRSNYGKCLKDTKKPKDMNWKTVDYVVSQRLILIGRTLFDTCEVFRFSRRITGSVFKNRGTSCMLE